MGKLTMPRSITAIGLLPIMGLSLISTPPCPAHAMGAPEAPRQQLARALLAIEQLEDEYRIVDNADVHQAPNAGSAKVETLRSGGVVLVTGRVTGTPWFRVWTDAGSVGYVNQRFIELVAPAGSPTNGVAAAPDDPGLPDGVFQDCDHCPQMVRIAPGAFTMGSAADPSEQPVRPVEIKQPFALGRFEVTVAQWQACVAAGACDHEPDVPAEPDRVPVRSLSWDDAGQYVAWLAKETGKPYRLPTEAEWEYAARAGTEAAYWWGEDVAASNAGCKNCGGEWDRKNPGLIGRFQANPFGLHDMNGSVAEWTADCWFDSYKGAPGDGTAREKRGCQQRALRGGSWRNEADYLRSASRMYYDAFVQYGAHGVRVALSLE